MHVGERGAIRPACVFAEKGAKLGMSDNPQAVDTSHSEQDTFPNRPQRRLLRRIFNGRTVPLLADGREFLTYKQAVRYLAGQADFVRNALYEELKQQALREQAAKVLAAQEDGADTEAD